jgi:hypothetical protein
LVAIVKNGLEYLVSLDLTIPCPKPFRGVELVVYAERALRDLLDLSTAPSLKVWHRQGSEDVPLGLEQDLGEGLPLLSIGLQGVTESIQMVYYRIDNTADWIPTEERGFRAGVAANEEELAWGGAVRLSLGAGLALGLARLQNTVVIDHKLSLSKNERQSPEEFQKTLCVKGPFNDFKTASEALFKRTPLQDLNSQRLRILEIERDVDEMMIELLGPIRLRQTVEWEVFKKFFALTDEWLSLSSHDKDMVGKLEGVLVLVDEFLLDEAKKIAQPGEVVKAAGEVEVRLGKLRAFSA